MGRSDVTEDFEAWAAAFVGQASHSSDIAVPELLDRSKLDFSVESLRAVDQYLERLHASDESRFSDDEYGNSVLWAAAYCGEVIRRNAKSKYRWMTYAAFRELLPAASKAVPEKETTQWVLCEPMGSVFTPIEKVMRRVTNGSDRLHPFVTAVLREGI
jgi:hypothetical protein